MSCYEPTNPEDPTDCPAKIKQVLRRQRDNDHNTTSHHPLACHLSSLWSRRTCAQGGWMVPMDPAFKPAVLSYKFTVHEHAKFVTVGTAMIGAIMSMKVCICRMD